MHKYVDGSTFPFYGKCAPSYATTYGLGADPEYLGSLAYGRTASWLRTVLSHTGDTRPLGMGPKALRSHPRASEVKPASSHGGPQGCNPQPRRTSHSRRSPLPPLPRHAVRLGRQRS